MNNLWMLYYIHFVIILQQDVTQVTEGAGVDLGLQSEVSMQMVCIHIDKLYMYLVEKVSV